MKELMEIVAGIMEGFDSSEASWLKALDLDTENVILMKDQAIETIKAGSLPDVIHVPASIAGDCPDDILGAKIKGNVLLDKTGMIVIGFPGQAFDLKMGIDDFTNDREDDGFPFSGIGGANFGL